MEDNKKTFSLNRRHFIIASLGGALSLVHVRGLRLFPTTKALALADNGMCTLAQEQVLGPYYLDKDLLRKDITEGKPGLPLTLRIQITD